MKKILFLVLVTSLALSPTLVHAKDNSDRFDSWSSKKTSLTCDKKNCWDSLAKSKMDHQKDKKNQKNKHDSKNKKDKPNKGKPHKDKKDKPGKPPVQAVPEVNAGGLAMGLMLAAALLLMMRERRRV